VSSKCRKHHHEPIKAKTLEARFALPCLVFAAGQVDWQFLEIGPSGLFNLTDHWNKAWPCHLSQEISSSWGFVASDQAAGCCGLMYTSPTVQKCHLGDLVGFCLGEMALYSQGRLLGIGLLLVRQFGYWLQDVLPQLLKPDPDMAIPSLGPGHRREPMALARKKGPVGKNEAKILCCSYWRRLSTEFGKARNKSKLIMFDGGNPGGEALDLFFCYFLERHIGGWLPLQVTIARACMQTC